MNADTEEEGEGEEKELIMDLKESGQTQIRAI